MRHRIIPLVLALALAAGLLVGLWRLPTRAAPAAGDGTFYDSGQLLGNETSQGVATGDIDGNGSLDLFVAVAGGNRVWLNEGQAILQTNGQTLGSADSRAVALGDPDADGDLDAAVANADGGSRIWINQGGAQGGTTGLFAGGQMLTGTARGVALGDLNGDLQLDLLLVGDEPGAVWFGSGDGSFAASGQTVGPGNGYGVALGDLDGDGDLDAFLVNGLSGAVPDTVWLNQGGVQGGTTGTFADSGQQLGAGWSYDIGLGDVDGDGDLDALVAQWSPGGIVVWMNDGSGHFSGSGQTLGDGALAGLALADVDGDGDLDAYGGEWGAQGLVWLNQGGDQGGSSGTFADSGQALATGSSYDGAFADLDGDGDPDLLTANFGPDQVWLNGIRGVPAATFDLPRELDDQGRTVSYQAAPGAALLPILLSHPPSQTLQVQARIGGPAATTTETLHFAAGERLKYLHLVNPQPDPSLAISLTLAVTPPGAPSGPATVTDRLLFYFVDGEQGLDACVLCYVEWLARLVGIDPALGEMHHYNLQAQQATALWRYYTALFGLHAPELSHIIATNPSVLWQALETVDHYKTAGTALGGGPPFTIGEGMVDDTNALLDGIQREAGPSLEAALARERQALALDSLAGLDVEQAWAELLRRRPISELYLTIIVR